MALNQQQLSTVFTKFSPILGEEVAEAVTQEFASRGGDDLVTKDFLRAELAEQLGGIRTELLETRNDLQGELGALRTESRGLLESQIQSLTRWGIGVMMTWGAFLVAVASAVG